MHQSLKSLLSFCLAASVVLLPALALAQIPPLPPGSDYPTEDGLGNPIDVPGDVTAKGYHVSPIRENVFWITDGNYHSLAVLHRRGVILVDAPQPLPFFGNMPVLPALAEIAPGAEVTHFIYSHAHTDHNGGASAIVDAFPGVKTCGHRDTARLLAEANDPRRPVPKRTFRKRKKLNIHGQRIELHHFGNVHQEGSTYIYLPDEKVLMVVDVIYPGWVPFRRLALSTDIHGWLAGHEALSEFDFDVLVTGHLTRLGTQSDVDLAKEYNADIKNFIDQAYFDVNTFFAAVGQLVGNGIDPFATESKWALFSAFYDASVQNCSDMLTAKWTGVLAGGETFNFSNCEAYFAATRLGEVMAPLP